MRMALFSAAMVAAVTIQLGAALNLEATPTSSQQGSMTPGDFFAQRETRYTQSEDAPEGQERDWSYEHDRKRDFDDKIKEVKEEYRIECEEREQKHEARAKMMKDKLKGLNDALNAEKKKRDEA